MGEFDGHLLQPLDRAASLVGGSARTAPGGAPSPMRAGAPEFNRNLGAIVWLVMRERGIAREEVVRTLGISHSTLSRLLNGKTSISLYHFVLLCRVLGCSPASLCAKCVETLSGVSEL